MNEDDMTRKRADAYLVLGNIVHINLRDGRFWRGIITSVESDKLILDERKLGIMPVMFFDIVSIEPYRERDKEVNH